MWVPSVSTKAANFLASNLNFHFEKLGFWMAAQRLLLSRRRECLEFSWVAWDSSWNAPEQMFLAWNDKTVGGPPLLHLNIPTENPFWVDRRMVHRGWTMQSKRQTLLTRAGRFQDAATSRETSKFRNVAQALMRCKISDRTTWWWLLPFWKILRFLSF